MIKKAAENRIETREQMRGGPGTITIRHCLEKTDFKAKIRLCSKLTIPPGAGIGPHPHETEDEIFIIEQGTGILDDGKTKTPVAQGDAILTGNGESHAIYNSGSDPLIVTAIIACY